MVKLNITGLRESLENEEEILAEGYNHDANGGTEQMARKIESSLDPELLDRFNIIHSHVSEANISRKKHNILVVHDTWNDPMNEHLKNPKSRERFAKIVFVSHHQQHSFNMGLGVPYAESVVLQNAIVPIESTRSTDQTEPLRLIYHTTPHRGLEILVPVVERVVEAGVNVHLEVFSSFNIYGPGWEQRNEPYQPLFERIANHPNMTYQGWKPNDIVRDSLSRAHMFAYPNIWPETSCIAMMEAMSAGLDIICPNFGALPETCGGFATMYNFDEDPNRHAQLFAQILMMAIQDYWSASNQNKLQFQSMYANNFYSWDLRSAQWNAFLRSLV